MCYLQIYNILPKSTTFWRGIITHLTAWKVSQYEVISDPYLPVFRLKKEIFSVTLRIQSEYKKVRTRNNSVFGHYHAVSVTVFRFKDLTKWVKKVFSLTLSWWRPLSYRNQSIDLRSLRHERVKEIIIWEKLIVPLFLFAFWKAQACYGKHYPQTIFFNAWYPPEGHTYLNKRTFQRKV